MNKIYYLYSKQGAYEAICICEGNKGIDNPFIISAEYPLGVIFSKVLRTLNAWLESPYKVSMQEKIKDFSNEDSSFSSVCCNDDDLKSIFNVLMNDDQSINKLRSFDEFQSLIKNYTLYIDECCKARENAEMKVPDIDMLVFSLGLSYPQKSIYPKIDFKDSLTKMKEYSPFKAKINYQSKRLFEATAENTVIYNNLKTPLIVYEINDISDLILASISAVFSQRYSIGKCRFCKNYFVSYDKKKKHCDNHNPNIKMDCYKLANKKRIADRKNSQSQRMYNSIRERLSRKGDGTEYKKFKLESKEWRSKIRKGEETEENYVAWLETKYVRKYKK